MGLHWRLMMRVFAYVSVIGLLAGSFSTGHAAPNQAGAVAEKPLGKLSSRLEALAGMVGQTADKQSQARRLGVAAEGSGSLLQNSAGEVLTYIRLANTEPATIKMLAAAGARITNVANAYRTVTAFVQPAALPGIAALAAVENVREELQPMVAGTEKRANAGRSAPQTVAPARADCPTATISEGDTQMRAAQARSTYTLDGSGITVGVISDSFGQETSKTSPAKDVATGDLPGPGNPCGRLSPVNVLRENPLDPQKPRPGKDEGRAMAQIVHSLAPGANLAFASANGGIFAFADAITGLQKQAGASVIVDDISYFIEPFYQDGPVSNAITQVASQGALYFTAAANYNATDPSGNEIASYEAPSYRPIACPKLTFQSTDKPPQTTNQYAKDCHNFNPSGSSAGSGLLLAPGGSIQLIFQWAEPWFGVASDFDVYIVTEDGVVVGAGNDTNNTDKGTQIPFESVAYQNPTNREQLVYLIIARASGGAAPRMKYVMTDSSGVAGTEFDATVNAVDTFGPTVGGHSAAANAISTAAVPYNDANTPEDFSSRGPAILLYGPVSSDTPAAPLPAPEIRNKPDVAATNGAQNTFFGQQDSAGTWRFFGTSAAAPHGAAVAALMLQRARQRNALLFQSTLNQLLRATASPMVNGSPAASGAGLINALAAVGAVNTLPEAKRTFLPFQQR